MTYEQALNKAAAYCSQAERAPQEVLQKLAAWETSEEDTEKVMEYLCKERYLDLQRYVHAFVNDKFTYEKWGRVKIAYALRNKGISGAIVENTLDDVIGQEQYDDTLVALLRGKLRGMSLPLEQKDRAKLYRFAAQRGFESAAIGRALRQLNLPEDEV